MIYNIYTITLLFNLLDFVTGMLKGLKIEKKLSSTKLRDGLFKKVGFIVVYILTYMLTRSESIIGFELPSNTPRIVCAYVIFTEVVSIIENVCVLNPSLNNNKLIKLLGLNREVEK